MNNTPHKSRKEALQHQRALYVNVPDARASEEQPMEVTASTELVLGSIRFEADEQNPRFLRFHDAVLARAETNANRDALDEDGIQELAATITGTAIDIEHDPKKNVGFYTAGRADSGALRVDGVLWLDRWFETQFSESYWPVTLTALAEMGPCREHVTFSPGASFMIDDLAVKTIALQHTGGCTGFRIEVPGAGSVVLATDYEVPETPDPDVVEFFEDAALLLADMQYRDTEYEGKAPVGRICVSRAGWGHGTPGRLFPTILACKRRPTRVRITHHDPKRSDEELDLFCEESAQLLKSWRPDSVFDYDFARDGDVFWL